MNEKGDGELIEYGYQGSNGLSSLIALWKINEPEFASFLSNPEEYLKNVSNLKNKHPNHEENFQPDDDELEALLDSAVFVNTNHGDKNLNDKLVFVTKDTLDQVFSKRAPDVRSPFESTLVQKWRKHLNE